jgi:hypothetical protein
MALELEYVRWLRQLRGALEDPASHRLDGDAVSP